MTDMQTTPTEDYYGEDIIPMTPGVQIPSAIGLSVLIVIGVGGNILTIIAYYKNIHTTAVYDFFIVNLAFADLILCCSSMPFYAVYTLMEFTWPFGYFFCKVWLVVDFTLCFETIMLMLILSLDRLLMINMGSVYVQKVTKSVAYIAIAVSWVVSFLVYGPAIIGWNHWVGYSTVEYMDCDVEFAYDHVFTTTTAIVEFILPFVCLTLLNAVLYFKIRKRIKVAPTSNNQNSGQANKIPMQGSSNESKEKKEGMVRPHSTRKAHGNQSTKINPNDIENFSGQEVQQKHSRSTDQPSNKYKLNNVGSEKSTSVSRAQGHLKAAKLLAALVLAFLVFWAPYTVTTMAISFCDQCVNTSLYEFFNWLLWMKSAVNPFLYAYNSRQYRKFFLKVLTLNGRFCRRNNVGREQATTVTSLN